MKFPFLTGNFGSKGYEERFNKINERRSFFLLGQIILAFILLFSFVVYVTIRYSLSDLVHNPLYLIILIALIISTLACSISYPMTRNKHTFLLKYHYSYAVPQIERILKRHSIDYKITENEFKYQTATIKIMDAGEKQTIKIIDPEQGDLVQIIYDSDLLNSIKPMIDLEIDRYED